jgi:hypothetical protein
MPRRKITPPDDIGFHDGEPVDAPDLGPEARDLDLMDGSREQRYYRGQTRSRDWNSFTIGVALLVVIGMLLPLVLVLLS